MALTYSGPLRGPIAASFWVLLTNWPFPHLALAHPWAWTSWNQEPTPAPNSCEEGIVQSMAATDQWLRGRPGCLGITTPLPAGGAMFQAAHRPLWCPTRHQICWQKGSLRVQVVTGVPTNSVLSWIFIMQINKLKALRETHLILLKAKFPKVIWTQNPCSFSSNTS